ncbi:MAG TPA: type IV pilus biogenesis/stability protein PilW [Usitatibacter sp.]|nr:type IV pilus biogenesis/stability protein PilW [Usitatibacter sp.]
MRRFFAAVLLALAAGCASQSSVESRPVTDTGGADARRRAEVHTALAGEYYARGNFAVALSEARLALKDDSSYYAAHNVLALIYMELREDVLARESFDRALRISPNNPEVLNNFGWFLCLRSEVPRGMEMMVKAAQDTQYASPEKAWLSAGLCMRRVGKNAEAEDAFRRAVVIRPDLIGALYNLALITYERGELKDAENYLMRYTRISPPTLDALVLGVRIARAKEDKVAEDSFMQQIRRRFPDTPELRALETR